MDSLIYKMKVFKDAVKHGISWYKKNIKDVSERQINKFHFEKLTPNKNIDISIYKEALDFAFLDTDIKNIAISGPYSSGKSSFIETYKKNNKNKKFIHISLSHFNFPTLDTEQQKNNRPALEGKIINQIIHQIPSNDIPLTNFKIKRTVSKSSAVIPTLLITLMVLPLVHIIFFGSFNNFINSLTPSFIRDTLSYAITDISRLVSGGVLFLVTIYSLYKIVYIQNSKHIFRKLKLQGNEIEIYEESSDSYFDKYLNEVLYLFEKINADAIVFEDIDRFYDGVIFERLREINTLSNIYLQKEHGKCLRFIYLIRDDVFVSKDRTKFFDSIIPVIPVLDSSNSLDMLLEAFKSYCDHKNIKVHFLQGLSLYIDDFRLLKNIYNEFTIYYHKLNTTELDANKMLGIISYKNIFPKDFSELQLSQGFIYNLLNRKSAIINTESIKLDTSITTLKKKIESINKEIINDEKELDAVYLSEIGRLNSLISNVYHAPSRENARAELDSITREKDIRLENIRIRNEGRIGDIEKEIEKINIELQLLKNKKLSEIITRENIDSIFNDTVSDKLGQQNDFNDIKGSNYFDLLKFLVREGYLDERYSDYMTFFYENSISASDKVFLRSVTDKKRKDYQYNIKNPAAIVSRLNEHDFKQEEVLNFDLLHYLLNNETHEKTKLKCFIKNIQENNRIDFIDQFFTLNKDGEIGSFIRCINLEWPLFFSYIVKKKLLSNELTELYSLYTLYYSNDNTITAVNHDNVLSDYISSNTQYLNIENPDSNKLIHGFSLIGVVFDRISFGHSNIALVNLVYENSFYKINSHNIEEILQNIYKENLINIKNHCYSIIFSLSETPLYKYIKNNINSFVDIINNSYDNTFNDTEVAFLDIVNDKDVLHENKIKYINHSSTIIENLSSIINNELWKLMLERNMVSKNENNILTYFSLENEIDLTLVYFINNFTNEIDLSPYHSQDNKIIENFFYCLIPTMALNNKQYNELVTTSGYYYDIFDILNIDDAKMQMLIEGGIIRLTEENLIFIRSNYSTSLLISLIKCNLSLYEKLLSDGKITSDDIYIMFDSDVDEKIKIELAKYIKTPIKTTNKNYSPHLQSHLLKNNFDEGDIPYLLKKYSSLSHEVKSTFDIILFDHRSELMNYLDDIDLSLLTTILGNSKYDRNQKIDIFIAKISILEKNDIIKCLDILELNDLVEAFKGKAISITTNNEKECIAQALKNRWLIDDYQITSTSNDPRENQIKITPIKDKLYKNGSKHI
ncbi:hypothetical protein ACK35M_18915 [Aeromonas veronii]